MECSRCGYKALNYDEASTHTCDPISVDMTDRGKIEYRSDGTRHPIKSKQDPGVILRQTKKRGINKK